MAKGDHLFYYRSGSIYSHHGLDCGDGTVIHYESSPTMKLWGTLSSSSRPRVQRVSMSEFAQGNQVFIREYGQCDAACKAVERALGRLGEKRYDIFGNNCEHFVVWCKTGEADSTQINAVRKTGKVAIRNGAVAAVLMRAVRFLPGPYRVIATTGTLAFTGASCLRKYLDHRFDSMRARES